MTALRATIAKDIRRLGPILIAWVLVMVLRLEMERQRFGLLAEEGELKERLWLFGCLLLGLELTVGFVLTAAIVQEDSPSEERAFWRTRPISGGKLLAAKLVSSGTLLLVAPLVVSLPWHLGGAAKDAISLSQLGAWHLAVVEIAFVLSALARGFGQFLGFSLGFLLLAGLFGAIWRSPGLANGAVSAVSLENVGVVLMTAVWTARVGAAAAIVVLYLSRRRPVALTVLGSFWSLAFLLYLWCVTP